MNGRKIFNTERAQRPGPTSHATRVTTRLAANMESVLINGMINPNILGTGAKIKLAESESTHG